MEIGRQIQSQHVPVLISLLRRATRPSASRSAQVLPRSPGSLLIGQSPKHILDVGVGDPEIGLYLYRVTQEQERLLQRTAGVEHCNGPGIKQVGAARDACTGIGCLTEGD